MAETYTGYRAFVASPGDCDDERRAVASTIERINRALRDSSGIHLDVRMWEHRVPVATVEEDLQAEFDREARGTNFFILILGKRYGSITPGYRVSNTEREIQAVLAQNKRDPKIKILSYFKTLADNPDQGPQEAAVRELRQKLRTLNMPSRDYATVDEFREVITHDLYETVFGIRWSPYKQNALRAFWQMGSGQSPRRLAIIYPPVERAALKAGDDPDFWLKRLTTQMAFEDYKALLKIEKGLRMIGSRSYQTYAHVNPPVELNDMNRVWLCLPRNTLAMRQLKRYPDLRFRMPLPDVNRPRTLTWRCATGENITVQSPMADYLKIQRKGMAIGNDWHGGLSQIVAKDFAILARLHDPRTDLYENDPMRDYVFAGIRGLGTWGAAWYLDRRYKRFLNGDPERPIELLLEVSFLDGKIQDVADVSDQPAEYFRNETQVATIKKQIKDRQA